MRYGLCKGYESSRRQLNNWIWLIENNQTLETKNSLGSILFLIIRYNEERERRMKKKESGAKRASKSLFDLQIEHIPGNEFLSSIFRLIFLFLRQLNMNIVIY